MAGAIGTNVVKDGNGVAIVGGVRMFDVSGTGAGPWVPVSMLYDPVSGNFGTIDSHGSLRTSLLDNNGNPVTFNGNGRASAANSAPVVPAYMAGQFVAASASAQQLGTTGAAADYLDGLWIIPATSAAGAVSVLWDGTNTRTVFVGGGTTALPTLAPFFVGFGFQSGNSGGFKVTTGTNVSAIAVGNFT